MNYQLMLRALRRDTGLLGLALALVGVVFLFIFTVTAAGLTVLSPEQFVAKNLGPYAQRIDVPTTVDIGQEIPNNQQTALAEPGWHLQLQTRDFIVDEDPAGDYFFAESDWEHEGEDFGIDLRAGSWPRHPGEVLVPPGKDWRPGDRLSAFGGSLPLTVAGVADNRWSPESANIYAAPGTWATADGVDSTRFADYVARPVVYDSSAGTTLVDYQWAFRAFEHAQDVELSRVTAAELQADPPASFADRYSFYFAVFALLLPPLMAAIALLTARRRFAAAFRGLEELGIARPASVLRLSAIELGLIAAGLLGATAAGVGLANAADPFFSSLTNTPERGWFFPGQWVAAIIAVTVLPLLAQAAAALASGWRLRLGPPRRSTQARRQALSRPARLAMAAACMALAVAIPVSSAVYGPEIFTFWAPLSVIFGIAAVALGFSALRLPAASPTGPGRLALRILSQRRTLCLTSFALLAATVGSTMFSGSLAASFTATTNAGAVSTVRADQASIGPLEENTIRVEELAGVEEELGLSSPVLLRGAPTALVPPANSSGAFGLYAVDKAADIESLLGRALAPEDRDELARGGLLVRSEEFIADGRARLQPTASGPGASLPARATEMDDNWAARIGGIATVENLRALNLDPVQTEAVYSQLTDAQLSALPGAAARAGLPPHAVYTATAAPEETPKSFVLSILAAVFTAAFAGIAYSQSLQVSLRRLRLVLFELGITSRWDRRILATLLGGTALTAVAGGVLAASLSLAVVHLVLGPTGFVVAWDWAASGWATLAVVAGALVGFALGRRRY